jgi:parallel beta-helix repeat protein
MTHRLPIPGQDDGTWGGILNDFLGVTLATDGTLNGSVVGSSQLQSGTVSDIHVASGAAIAKTKLSASVQTSLAAADTSLQPANNLSDLPSTTTARSNLGLGSSATRNIGTISGTVAAGDDSRLSGAVQSGDLVINVKDLAYGAKGDGSTNDTAAIQAALSAVPSKGATVYFPPGSYLVSAQITVLSNTTLLGAGNTVSNITCTTAINAVFVQGSVALSNVVFRNLGWIGGAVDSGTYPRRSRTTTSSFLHAVQFDGSLVPSEPNPVITDVSFENCKVTGSASLPIFFRGLSGNTRIVDSLFYNCMDVGVIFCESVLVTRNKAIKSADNGFSISRGNQRAVVTNNIADSCSYWGVFVAGFVIGGSSSYPSYTGPQDFVVTGNVITNCGYGGICLDNAPSNGTVVGNTVDTISRGPTDGPTDNYGVGIFIGGFPTTSPGSVVTFAQNIVCTENTLLNCARGGIYIRGLQGGKISSNIIINPGSQFLADGVTTPTTSDATENFGVSVDFNTTCSNLDMDDNLTIDNRGTTRANFSTAVNTSTTNLRCRGNRGIGVLNPPSESFETFTAAKNFTNLVTTTAGLRIGSTSGTTNLFARIDGAAGSARRFVIGTGSQVDRWAWTGNGTSESGSNVGTDFELRAYNDSGTLLWTPVTVTRSSGLTSFGRAVALNLSTQTLSSNGAVTFDARAGNNLQVTLGANATSSSIINPATGQDITLTFVQDATGSRTYTWPTGIVWATGSAPTAQTAANTRDSVTLLYDGTNWNELTRSHNTTTGASAMDPLGWGIATNVGPIIAPSTGSVFPAVNQINYYRLIGGGVAITKGRVRIQTQSGNLAIAFYSNSGTGLNAVPGTLLASSGVTACPVAGSADLSLGATITPNAGDWVGLWADNTTISINATNTTSVSSSLYSGRAYTQTGLASGPPNPPSSLTAGTNKVFEIVGVP